MYGISPKPPIFFNDCMKFKEAFRYFHSFSSSIRQSVMVKIFRSSHSEKWST